MDNLVPLAGIYVITHIPTGRKYVGQGVDVDRRLATHRYGCSHGAIGDAIRAHGADAFSFDVVERVQDEILLHARESHWIRELNCMAPAGFNQITQRGTIPQCSTDGKPVATAERQSRHRAAAKAAGGAFVSTPIGQDAAHALDALRAQGLTVRQAVERALEATAKGPAPV